MNAALDVGADVAFLEAHHSDKEMEQIPKLIHGPCLLNVGRFGKSPAPPLRTVADMGYRIAILPGMLLTHVIGSCEHILKELRDTQCHPVPFRDLTIHELWRACGSASWDAVQEKFK
jgi:2-methylisocitrate lyase-like PEP mutase family enzyme